MRILRRISVIETGRSCQPQDLTEVHCDKTMWKDSLFLHIRVAETQPCTE